MMAQDSWLRRSDASCEKLENQSNVSLLLAVQVCEAARLAPQILRGFSHLNGFFFCPSNYVPNVESIGTGLDGTKLAYGQTLPLSAVPNPVKQHSDGWRYDRKAATTVIGRKARGKHVTGLPVTATRLTTANVFAECGPHTDSSVYTAGHGPNEFTTLLTAGEWCVFQPLSSITRSGIWAIT